jgi:hypothetical protein
MTATNRHTQSGENLADWKINILLALGGVSVALIIVSALFIGSPDLRNRIEMFRDNPNVVQYRVGMGDLLLNQIGSTEPPEDPNHVLAEYELLWDQDGFRIPANPAETYDVIALGDSFTEAPNVAFPWTDTLAKNSGLSVRNLGVRGYGPFEETIVMQEYGAASDAKYTILGYFEGNDIANIQSFDRTLYELPEDARNRDENLTIANWTFDDDLEGPYKYPVTVELNGELLDMVFLEGYIWALNADLDDYVNAHELDVIAEQWAQMDTANDACFIVAYFPEKAHIYLPYVVPEHQDRILQNAYAFNAIDDQWLHMTKAPDLTYDVLLARLNNQRDPIQQLANSHGYPFVDLTPAFQAYAAQGEALFYTYDTHPNQAGQNLAGEVIADFLATNPCS